MYCKHCGREIGDGQRFCGYCGARQQEDAPQTGPEPGPQAAPEGGSPYFDQPQPAGNAPAHGGNALLTIFAILCAVVYGFRAVGIFFGVAASVLHGYFFSARLITQVLLVAVQAGVYVCMCLLLLAMAVKSTRENREAYFFGVSCAALAALAVMALRILLSVLIEGLLYGYYLDWASIFSGFFLALMGFVITVGGLWVLMYLDGQRALVGKSAEQLRQLGYDLSDAVKELRFSNTQSGSDQTGARPQYQSASTGYGAGAGQVNDSRDFVLYVVLTIITCGIYSLVFLYSLIRDVNTVCDGDGENTRGLLGLILLSLVTCGIYSFYWYYCLGNRLAKNAPRYGLSFQENGTTVLLWMVVGSLLCGLGSWVAVYIVIKNCNQLCGAYNRTYGG